MLPISGRFRGAVDYAMTLHGEHARKGGNIPYIAHLFSVAALAMEYGADEDEAIAALLHDAVEDQGGRETLEAIRQMYGGRVAGIVEGCTDAFTQPKPPWRQRKERYISNLKHADPSVRLVSACDKLHNARSILSDYRAIGEPLFERFNAGREEILWFYYSLIDVFEDMGPQVVGEELMRVVAELEQQMRINM